MSNDIFVRLPSLPLNFLHSLFEIANDEHLSIKIDHSLDNEEIKKALFLAHPALMNDSAMSIQKTLPVLLHYLIRMSYRPTPNGLLSSIGKVVVSDTTTLFNSNTSKKIAFKSTTRFFRSSSGVEKSLHQCSFRKNPTLKVIGDEAWLWASMQEGFRYSYKQLKYRLTDDVLNLIEMCQHPQSANELKRTLKLNQSEIESFYPFLEELVSLQILQTDNHESTLGNSTEEVLPKVTPDQNNLAGLPRYAAFKADQKIELSNNNISQELLSNIQEALSGIWNISEYWQGDDFSWYRSLKDAFRTQYYDKSIPLTDFLHFHIFPKSSSQKNSPEALRSFMSKLFNRAASNSQDNIELSDEDVEELKSIISSRPDSEGQIKDYSVILSLADSKRSPFVAKLGVSAWGLGALRGKARFMYMFPEGTFNFDIASTSKIYFDIEFDSKDHFFDVSKRPYSTTHVLNLNHTKSPTDKTLLNLEDIDVCLQGNFFKLFSRSQKKELVPVITTPYLQIYHDHPVYRFLGFVAQDGQKVNLKLPFETESLPFVPSVSFKGILIHPKKWTMTKLTLIEIIEVKRPRPSGMPDWVAIRNQDRVLPLNLNSPYISKILLRKFKDQDLVTLEDEWHMNHGRHLEIDGKSYTHELMIQWINSRSPELKSSCPQFLNWTDPAKNPISIHITLPSSVTEIFLSLIVIPYLESLIRKNVMTNFYFIRYSSPENQIRLRIFSSKVSSRDKLWETIIRKFEPYRKEYAITSIALSPFEKEEDTYGGSFGESLYHEISQILSRSYLKRSKLRSQDMERLPFEICYLVILYIKLLELLNLEISLPSDGPSIETKRLVSKFWKTYNLMMKEGDSSKITLDKHVSSLGSELEPLIKKWTVGFEKGKILIEKRFFFHRLMHMEFFRVLGPEYSMIEKSIPYLAAKVLKHAY